MTANIKEVKFQQGTPDKDKLVIMKALEEIAATVKNSKNFQYGLFMMKADGELRVNIFRNAKVGVTYEELIGAAERLKHHAHDSEKAERKI